MIALVLALAQAKTVTFTHPCANSAVVLEALGKEIGRTIKPSGSVNQDYFLVRFDGVPVGEAMTKIADALNASWAISGGVYYLSRTGLDLQEEAREESEALAKRIAEYVAKNQLAPLPSIESIADRYRGLRDLDYQRTEDRSKALAIDSHQPQNRAAMRILAGLRPRDLASMKIGSSAVFSREPTKNVLPLTPAMRIALNTMRAEFATLAEAVSRAGLTGHKNLSQTSLKWLDHEETNGWTIDVKIERREGASVRIQKAKEQSGFHSGYEMGGASVSLINFGSIYDTMRTGLEVALEIPEKMQRIQKSLGKFPRPAFAELVPEAQEMLLDLSHNEPLAMTQSVALLQAARIKGWNIVAVLDDDGFLGGTYDDRKETPWQTVAGLLRVSRWKIEDGFVTVTPKSPERVRTDRFDRAALSRAIKRAAKQDWLDLVCSADIALVSSTEEHYLRHNRIVEHLFPNQSFDFQDYPWLKMLGSLMRRNMNLVIPNDATIPFSSLNKAQLDAVSEALKSARLIGRSYSIDTPGIPMVRTGQIEVPEGYKNGRLPSEGTIRIKNRRTDAIFALPRVIESSTYVSGAMTPEDLADLMSSPGREERPGPDFEQLRLLPMERLEIVIKLPEGTINKQLESSGTGTGVPYMTFEKLPLETRKAFEKAMKWIKKHGGGGNP